MVSVRKEFSESEETAISQEFQRLDNNVYLDHAGATLYSEKQIENYAQVLTKNVFANPHTCKLTGDLLHQVRQRILSHFNTDSTQYSVIFTANASQALKIVAETFDFSSNVSGKSGNFYYCQENHTSVLGMRECIDANNQFVLTTEDLLKNRTRNEKQMIYDENIAKVNSLLVFSAQCNFSGFKMPLEIVENIQENGLQSKGVLVTGKKDLIEQVSEEFYVCLDTASYVSTNYLDLTKYTPDFCCISFYKIFGFPTGVGALLVSKRGEERLKKKYYGGGTVKVAMSRQNFHVKRDCLMERFEDGTLPYLSIIALLDGYNTVERLIPSKESLTTWERISHHVFNLAKYCYSALEQLTHVNGNPLVKFYNHTSYNHVQEQGGIVTFNILHDVGSYVGYAEVACIASVFNIKLRTGCFCNPGACQRFLGLSDSDIKSQFEAGHVCSDYNDLIDGVPTGAIRVSFGYMSTYQDVEKLVKMVRDCYMTTAIERLRLIDVEKLPSNLKNIPNRLKPRLLSIDIYPVKSCGAFRIDKQWKLEKTGLKYDRSWMIVDSNNLVLTQKHDARLCLILPYINIPEGFLELRFEDMKPIKIPLEEFNTKQSQKQTKMCQSKVCSDFVQGTDCGDDVAEWLSVCLDRSVRLIRQSMDRKTSNGEANDLSLANQAQFLLINKTSVSWLSGKVETDKEPVQNTVDRFRGNFLIETAEPLDENNYESISIGSITFKVEGFCTRCQMICIDQHSGQKTAEPLKTIAREMKGKIRFGIYLSANLNDKSNVNISVNDEIIVKRKEII